MHHLETMNPFICSAACKAASEPDPSNPLEQPHGSRRSCLPQQRPRQSRALAGTRRGGALTQRRSMKFSAVRPLTLQASGAERDTGAEATALSASVHFRDLHHRNRRGRVILAVTKRRQPRLHRLGRRHRDNPMEAEVGDMTLD